MWRRTVKRVARKQAAQDLSGLLLGSKWAVKAQAGTRLLENTPRIKYGRQVVSRARGAEAAPVAVGNDRVGVDGNILRAFLVYGMKG